MTHASPWFRAYLLFTTALCGAMVMVVQVLGSRVIGPFFGVSLFVWTALIAITLIALAAGYAIGGWFADRRPDPGWLYGLITVAGVFVVLVPMMKPWVIPLAEPLGLRGGTLVSALILFSPSLFLLGCVSPYVVRIATRELSGLGRTVGLLYALSTTGSFIGTVATGFYLIAYIGVTKAFYLAGLTLCLLGAGYFLLFRRRVLPVLAALPALLAWNQQAVLPQVTMANGTQVRLVEALDSFYGSVRVIEYSGHGITTRELTIDGLIQGGIDTADGRSIYEYAYLLDHLSRQAVPGARSALVVGLGAGIVARSLTDHGIDVEVVDIDRRIVEAARRHFGLRLDRPVVVQDARYHMRNTQRRYDIIVLDAFTGDAVPGHLLTTEALGEVAARLTPGGVVAMNIMSAPGKGSDLAQRVVRTLGEHLPHIAAFPLYAVDGAIDGGGNLVLVAAREPLDALLAAPAPGGVHRLAREGVALAMRQAHRAELNPAVPVLTDDFNPLDVLDIALHEKVRRTIVDSTPAAILLHG
jgi:spermidine synthase